MRAVVYARVSSQAQRDRHTIASQLSVLPQFVTERGWELVRPGDHYVDDGRTAKAGHLDEREAFGRLLRDAEAGAFDVVVVIDLDRLTRSEDLTERGRVLGTFQRARVSLAIASSGQVLDLATSSGDLFATLQAFFAAEENRKRRERTVRGKIEKISQGRKPSGPTPFGLSYDRSTGAWGIDEPAANVVREIYQRVATGESCEAISNDFQARGIRRRFSRCWSRERVWALVTNRTYRGEWTADKARKLVVKVPAVVTAGLWDDALGTLVAYGKRGLDRTKHVYLLQKVAVCALCGARIHVSSASKNARRAAYYVCKKRFRPDWGEASCKLPMRRVADVDARVWTSVSDFLARPDLLEEAVAKRRAARVQEHDWGADLRGPEAKLRRLDQVEVAVLERFRRGQIGEVAMDRETKATARERRILERQVEAARSQAAGAQVSRAGVEEALATVATLRARLANASPEVRREIVLALVPGSGDYVVRLGSDEIVVLVVVGGGSPTAACRLGRAGSDFIRTKLLVGQELNAVESCA